MKRFVMIFLFVALTAAAGHRTGNGGGVMVCPAASGRQVELLDFWEGGKLRRLAYRRSRDSVWEQVRRALGVLEPQLQGKFSEVLATAEKLYRSVEVTREAFLAGGIKIAAPEDALSHFVQAGCHVEGVALYNDRFENLEVDGQNYIALSPTGRAGLLVHEALYRYLRQAFQVSDSVAARGLTACAFAEKPCAEIRAREGLPEHYYQCWLEDESRSPEMALFLRGEKWRLQILTIASPLARYAPTARAYVDLSLTMPVTIAAGVTFSPRIGGLKAREVVEVITRSSDDRWRDFGVPMTFRLGRTYDAQRASYYGDLQLNGRRLRCLAP